MEGAYTVVLGLGKTGLSCIDYLSQHNCSIVVCDSRDQPPNLAAVREQYPKLTVQTGPFQLDLLLNADEIICSPGIDHHMPVLQQARDAGVPIHGDIELFVRAAKAPIVGITGSNGKTTVTTLLGEMVANAGLNVAVGGNIGEPALHLLSQPVPDFYVLELSSFQLELTDSLAPFASVILNLSPDHLDRHHSVEDYLRAKQVIYRNCQHPVVNLDEPQVWQGLALNANRTITFTKNIPKAGQFGLRQSEGDTFLCWGDETLVAASSLPLKGEHHWQNALAALALGAAMSLPMDAMIQTLQNFRGLAHRCQLVREHAGIAWFNDSKGTNVGATVAALQSVGDLSQKRVLLIAGGDSKAADLDDLIKPVGQYVSTLFLIGRDAPRFSSLLSEIVPIVHANSLEEAVAMAASTAQPGDRVLLSPACASFDMFNNFEHRGDVFTAAVEALT